MLLLNLLGCGKAEKEDRSVDSMRSFARYAPMVFATETADTIYFMAPCVGYACGAHRYRGISCDKARGIGNHRTSAVVTINVSLYLCANVLLSGVKSPFHKVYVCALPAARTQQREMR